MWYFHVILDSYATVLDNITICMNVCMFSTCWSFPPAQDPDEITAMVSTGTVASCFTCSLATGILAIIIVILLVKDSAVYCVCACTLCL